MNRDLARIARRLTDQQSDRIATAGVRPVIATVTTATAAGASDGNYLVKVTWRGQEVTAAGYAASYTPVVGHRVVCAFVDNQLIVVCRIVGQP